jgi:hypothetical protein
MTSKNHFSNSLSNSLSNLLCTKEDVDLLCRFLQKTEIVR